MGLKLDEDITSQCKITLEKANKLTKSSVEQRKKRVEMENVLAAAQKEYASTSKVLRKSEYKLKKEMFPLQKVYKITRATIEKTGQIEMTVARQKKTAVK